MATDSSVTASPMRPPTVEATAATHASEPVRGAFAIEAVEPMLPNFSGLMRPFVLGGRPSQIRPAAASVEFLPVAKAVSTVHMAVARRVDVAAETTARHASAHRTVEKDVNVVAPVVVDVHVTDAAMPAPATAAVPPQAPMPAPVRPHREAELESGEDVDAKAQVERTPAPGHRRRKPQRVHPARVDVTRAEDHAWTGRHDRPQIARRIARVHDIGVEPYT